MKNIKKHNREESLKRNRKAQEKTKYTTSLNALEGEDSDISEQAFFDSTSETSDMTNITTKTPSIQTTVHS
jgi:hypothetical protein